MREPRVGVPGHGVAHAVLSSLAHHKRVLRVLHMLGERQDRDELRPTDAQWAPRDHSDGPPGTVVFLTYATLLVTLPDQQRAVGLEKADTTNNF